MLPPEPSKPFIEYTEGDSVSLTVAESGGDFSYLSGDGQRKFEDLHSLVPKLPDGEKDTLLAIQITVFPGCGICIGFALRPVVADGRTFDNFLKMWASLACKNRGEDFHYPVAIIDRSVIHDPSGLESTFLKEWWNMKNSEKKGLFHSTRSNFPDMVRSTFVLGRPEMEKIKKWILLHGTKQMFLSPYVLTCAFVWVCWMKTHWPNNADSEEVHFFGFIAGGISRLNYPVPASYVGNCVAFGRLGAIRKDLMAENGIVYAAKVIGNTIKKLDGNVLEGAKNWISEWKMLLESDLHVTITGSPKLKFYSLDFGWGRPEKIEVSIDEMRAISLCESRDVVGGIEIGLTLPKSKMDHFTFIFNKCLNNLF